MVTKSAAALFLCLMFALPSHSEPLKQSTGACSGLLGKSYSGIAIAGKDERICRIARSEEEKVFKSCLIGERCRITGVLEDCEDDEEECSTISRVYSAKSLSR